MRVLVTLCLSFCLCSFDSIAQRSLNLDFELIQYTTQLPKNWYVNGAGYNISIDSVEKHSGKISLKMEMQGDPRGNFGVFTGTLPIDLVAGKCIEYKGWVKTKEIKNGYAGLWFRVDGDDNVILGFDNMNDRGLKGDNDWTQVAIKIDVSKDVKNINFGGLFPGDGTVWFDNLELYIDNEKYIDLIEPEPKVSLSHEEIQAIKKYIYPLRTYEADGGDTRDLNVLDRMIGSSKVVALGEVSHGSSEIFKMKNRIIQYLAANKGFDVFSIEANMPESYKVNDYSVRGEGDPDKLIAGMYFWTWRTEEVLDMVKWMRKFNQPQKRIEFTGFDMQFYEGAVDELIDAFKGNAEAQDKISALNEMLGKIRASSRNNRGLIAVGKEEMEEVKSLLSFLKSSVETSFQTQDKEWLLQNITIIEQYLGKNSFLWRDKCMADNLLWIKNNNPESKFIIWAHNAHIQKTNEMMGDHLSQKLGDDYKTFGFAFFNGSYTAAGNKGLTAYNAIHAYPGTLEYLLEQINEPIFVLDLKKIKSDNPKGCEWLKSQLEFRSVGAMGGLPYEFWDLNVSDNFDYLIFIRTSSPSKLFD